MRCYSCGGTYKEKHGKLNLSDDFIGSYSVYDVDYHKCNKCGGLLFPLPTARVVEEKRDSVIDGYIKSESIGNFISSAETAKILEISRQALSNDRRIRRGFIYGIKIGKITLYHKKSVELFKCAGDGRFNFNNKKLPKGRLKKKTINIDRVQSKGE